MPKEEKKHSGLKIKIIGNFIPRYQTSHSAGCDLCADIQKPVVLKPRAFCAIPTGIRIEIPAGYEAQVRPRSGLALKYGIGILNTPGTIDADYRGEIKVILFNFGTKSVRIKPGDRIAQMVIARVIKAEFRRVRKLNRTERGSGGFGHTGGID
ncbi:MAG: dUTP diphosphatase [candidate division WOR-3 bacterium]